MKKLLSFQLLALVLVFTAGSSFSQIPSWEWALAAGGSDQEVARAMVCDSFDNVYVVGTFSSPSVSFGSLILTHTPGAETDLFLVKYDAAGNAVWARSAGGSGADGATTVCLMDSRELYVGGYFTSNSITFGAHTLTNPNPPEEEMFIVRYDIAGNVIWAKNGTGNTGSDAIRSLAADQSGFIVGTGYFQGSSLTLGSTTLTNAGTTGKDIFVVKLNREGNVIWVKGAGGTADDLTNAVAVDPAGNVYIGGQFTSPTLNLHNFVLNNNSSGTNDAFIAKFDNQGSEIWGVSAGGSHHDYVLTMDAGVSGEIYAAGYFRSTSITIGATTLTNLGSPFGDYFLAKFNAAGGVQWTVKSNGSSSSDAINSVAADPFGCVYITGQFQSPSIVFGPNTLTNTTSQMQAYVARVNGADGSALWGMTAHNTNHDQGYSIAPNYAGYAFVAGYFSSTTLTFGPTVLTNAGTGTNDLFIAKMNGSVGISGSDPERGLLVCPNPFSDRVIIRAPHEMRQAVLRVYDCSGRAVRLIGGVNGNEIVLNRNELAGGIYFIQLTEDGKTPATARVIVHH